MSLPTPPSTSHRDKENRFASRSRVAWSQHNQYHCFASTPPLQPTSVSKDLPSKSILKRSPPLLNIPEDNKREITPEPSNPLTDPHYLEYPVSRIIASDASLRDLIEAYSVLTARIKAATTGATESDTSWPLLQPLRDHSDAVVDALVRDIGKAAVDPGTATIEPEEPWEQEKISLPSPKESPRKKKGMTAEQVKYARDLCTTSHAVMRLLAVMFTLPAIYRIFNDEQLRSMLTEVLAIPLANELPTPNARKTCALSIWLLQVQRLPSEVLAPAKDRIAYALRRGIEGELGKEGKKGSASDGLKAIHDLSIYQSATFVPAFTELLPSIFSNLLAQTLTLRAQACHALGGFVLGITSLSSSYVHTRVSAEIASFLTTTTILNETTSKSPSKPSQDPAIIRTLRTTLGATDPQHVAQGPVWALSVIASFIVLLGPALCTDIKLTRIISALLSLSMRHKKSSVRAIGCLVWRCVAWVYVQPPLVQADGESEVDDDENDEVKSQNQIPVRESYWKIVKSVVDMGAGVSTVAALLGNDTTDDENLKRAMALIKVMVKRGGQTRGDAMEMVRFFVTCNASETGWDSNKLLPPALFSSSPGLLTVDYSSLVSVVKPIFNQCPQFDDVRSLTREELSRTWVFDELIEIWKEILSSLETLEDLDISSEIISIWDGLLKANITELQEAADDNGTLQFASRAVNILVDILQDADLDLTIKAGSSPNPPTSPIKKLSSRLPASTISPSRSNAALKLSVTRKLWSVMRSSIPHRLLSTSGEVLLEVLLHNEDELIWEVDSPNETRREWSLLCAEALVVCDIDELKAFWGERRQTWAWTPGVRSMVWTCFVQKWLESGEGSWEGAVALLAIPFADATTWDLSNEDFDSWDEFLGHTMTKTLDYGVDSITALDQIACTISCNHSPTLASSARVADMLMSHLEIADARQIPDSVFEFVNNTLQSSYPPEPRNMIHSLWMIRSLTHILHDCPHELALNLLGAVQDGMCTWISDEYRVLSQGEYAYDILPMYQIALLSIKAFSETIETLSTISPLLESAFCGRHDKPAAISETFIEFWQSTYSRKGPLTDGWPTTIQNCLQAAFGLPKVAVERITNEGMQGLCCDADTSFSIGEWTVSQDNIDKDELEYPDSDDEHKVYSERPFSFKRPLKMPSEELLFIHSTPQLPAKETKGKERSIPGRSSQLQAVFNAFEPSTPTRTSSSLPITSTPLRPHKPSTIFQLFPPDSIMTESLNPPVTPTRTPLGQSGSDISSSDSSKRRRLENKENMSPHPVIVPVMERIAVKSPGSSVLGKRRSSGQLPGEQALKKGKFLTTLMQVVGVDYGQKVNVEPELVEFSTMTKLPSLLAKHVFSWGAESVRSGTHSDSGPGSPTKKRKRVFMDAVEVPTWQEVKNKSRTTSLNLRSSQNKVLRRTQSVMAMTEHAVSESSDKKCKRERSVVDLFPPSSLSDLAEVGGSDDSIMQPSSPSQRPSDLSSDDDTWHLGQVTPHHLISPALRRAQQEDFDPPSDDSIMSVSPSRDLVARRQQRLL